MDVLEAAVVGVVGTACIAVDAAGTVAAASMFAAALPCIVGSAVAVLLLEAVCAVFATAGTPDASPSVPEDFAAGTAVAGHVAGNRSLVATDHMEGKSHAGNRTAGCTADCTVDPWSLSLCVFS